MTMAWLSCIYFVVGLFVLVNCVSGSWLAWECQCTALLLVACRECIMIPLLLSLEVRCEGA
jgi:hypothetical protein